MPLTDAERQRRYYARHTERVKARANAFYRRNCERLRLKRLDPGFRAKRAAYMRRYRAQEAGLTPTVESNPVASK